MNSGTQARAEWRALLSAALIGSGVGLGLGATYLAAGMAGHAADYARAERIAEAAASGYAGAYPEAQDALSDAAAKARRADLECLTEAVYYEARGESARGQAAVAQVVMNRVRHPAFPKTVCAVVFQGAGHRGCQFSFACDGSMRRAREAVAWSRARRVAARALAGAALADIGSATHFHTTAVAPAWGAQMRRVAMVGTHVFYKFAPYRLRVPASPLVETAVLISAPRDEAQPLRLEPALVEKAIEKSLEPAAGAADPKAASSPLAAVRPAEAAALTAPQPVSATTS